jgi:DNA-binding response OmpR family regulator
MNESDQNSKPILLMVEDEEDTANLIKLIMEAEGFLVVHVSDGRQALEQIDGMPPPDVVLMDIQIPHVSGLSVLGIIRTKPEWNGIPIVMLTADSAQAEVRRAMDLGVQDYIVKPFKREVLVTRLQRLSKQTLGKETSRMSQAQSNLQAADPKKETVIVDASFEPLMPKFMANRKKEVTAMQEALARQDFETVQKIAHGAKGAGGSYGFDRIAEIAAASGQAARAADAVIIQWELPVLSSYLDRVEVVYE